MGETNTMVDLRHIWTDDLGLGDTETVERSIDLRNYYKSSEWDLIGVPGKKNIIFYPCCDYPYLDITFNLTIRRKALFYTINLLVPCLSINMLTCLTLYLPSDSGEKISLCITLLLSLSMFQLLLMELIPSTSIKVPLMGKYILFTTVSVSLSVLLSVVTLNVNFRSSATHHMPNCTRKLFLEILPRLLLMKKPAWYVEAEEGEETYWSDWNNPMNDLTQYEVSSPNDPGMRSPLDGDPEDPFVNQFTIGSTFIGADSIWKHADMARFCRACAQRRAAYFSGRYPLQVQKALEGVQFIEKHHRDDDESHLVRDEWKYTALVIDRILLWTYISICTVGGASVLLNAPMLYSKATPLT